MAKWRQMFSEAQKALPRTATPRQRGEATRQAARRYRGEAIMSNPGTKDWVKWGVVAVAVYVGLQLLNRPGGIAAPKP